jgi:hypothetical protein
MPEFDNDERQEQQRRDGAFEKFVRDELKHEDELLQEILENQKHPNTVTGGIIRQVGVFPMIALKPGNSPQFAVTPQPAGVKTLAAQVKVTSADPADVIVLNSADPTGLTFIDTINPAAVEPITLTLTWTYTNTDGSVATVTGTFSEVTDVTGGTMAQVA